MPAGIDSGGKKTTCTAHCAGQQTKGKQINFCSDCGRNFDEIGGGHCDTCKGVVPVAQQADAPVKLEITSTRDIVLIQDIPCRKWTIDTIDGVKPLLESYVFTRMLAISIDVDIDDSDLIGLDGPNPPKRGDIDATTDC